MKRIIIMIILGIFVPAFFFNHIYAEDRVAVDAERALIIFKEGEVEIKQLGAGSWRDAEIGILLARGDNLRTGPDSWAEIGFGKYYQNVVRIKEETLVELIELGPIRIGLLRGEIRTLVERLSKGSTFEIKTPTAVCGARGTGWDTATDGTKVVVETYEREVYFNRLSKDGKILEDATIKAGKRGVLDDPATPLRIRDLPTDRMRNWNRWKTSFLERRRGIVTTDIKSKANRLAAAQKALDAFAKAKEAILEKKDEDLKKDRVDKDKSGSCGNGY